MLSATRTQLQGVQTDITKAIEALKGRESHINAHLEHMVPTHLSLRGRDEMKCEDVRWWVKG